MCEEEKKTEKKPTWEKQHRLGSSSTRHLEIIAKNILLLIEEEKRMTMEKLTKTKELLERMRVS